MNKPFAVEVQHSLDPAVKTIVARALEENLAKKGPLLPILHHIQGELKHVPKESVPMIAEALNLSRAEVHGVISFYHSFTSKPQGKYVVEVCSAESCQAMGGRALAQSFRDALGIDFGETTHDGLFSLEPVYCLGHCACSPSVRIGEDIYSRVDQSQAERLVVDLKARSNGAK